MQKHGVNIFPWYSEFDTGIDEIDLHHRMILSVLDRVFSYVALEASEQEVMSSLDSIIDYLSDNRIPKKHLWSGMFAETTTGENEHWSRNELIKKTRDLKKNIFQNSSSSESENLLSNYSYWIITHIFETGGLLDLFSTATQRGMNKEDAQVWAKENIRVSPCRIASKVLTDNSLRLMRETKFRNEVLARLSVSEDRLREAMEYAKIGYWDLPLNSKRANWSPQMYRLFGLSTDLESGPETLCSIMKADYHEPFFCSVSKAFETGCEHHVEYQIVRPTDGQSRWIECRGKVLYKEDGSPEKIAGFIQDITDRIEREKQLEATNAELHQHQVELERRVDERTRDLKLANQRLEEDADRLEKARNEAEEANRAKSVFLATMSHEIRTPMSGILGTASLLSGCKLNDEQLKYAQTIADSGALLMHVINDILDYSKIEAGHLTLEKIDFSLHSLIQRIEDLFSPEAAMKGLTFDSKIDADLPLYLSGDPARVQQVLSNLLSNAIKFTDRGGVALDVSLHGAIGSPNSQIRFTVSDTGIGIADGDRRKLFNAFSQAEDSIPRRYGGTGLGLAICDRLVIGMGGQIDWKSTPGEGSTFWFTLPLKRGRLPVISPDENGDISTCPANLTILLAEDILTNRFVARSMLEKMDHKVLEAMNGEQAVAMAEQHRPDIILMDISMPVMDGFAATKQLRAHADSRIASIPIIAATAHVVGLDMDMIHETGFSGYLSKPFDCITLRQALQKAIASKVFVTETMLASDSEDAVPLFDPAILEQDLEMMGIEETRELIEIFLREVPSLLQAIYDAPNAQEASRKAHTLKGAAGNVGLTQLVKIAQEIEAGGASDALKSCMAQSLKALRDYRATLN